MLVLSYLMVALILGYTSATSAITVNETRIVRAHGDVTRAFLLAESGLDAAIGQLRAGSTAAIKTASLGKASNGTYSATISQPTSFGTDQYLLEAAGQENGLTQTLQIIVQQTATSGDFPAVLFGILEVTARGSIVTDSYDSSIGYVLSRGTNGDILTNSTTTNSVKLVGSAVINGDIVVGPTADVTTTVNTTGAVSVTGTQTAAATTTVVSAKTAPANCLQRGPLHLQGASMTLAAGTYCYDSIELTGTSIISGTGPIEIYVSGAVTLAGSSTIQANNEEPPQMTIYVTGSSDVQMSGNTTMYAGLHAPNSDVTFAGSSVLYGAAVGENIVITGSAVLHYDEAISTTGTSSSPFSVSVLSWHVPKPN